MTFKARARVSDASAQSPAPALSAPLSNGIFGKRKPQGFYSKMSDDEVLAHSRQFIAENGIRNRKGLEKADGGLYKVLRGRGLLDAVFFKLEHSKHADAVEGVLDALESFGDPE